MTYRYNAKVLDVYDGDTCTILIDVGFNIHLKERCRLNGIDTPEIRTKCSLEKAHGIAARNHLRELILDKDIEIETVKEGKFGRYLVDIYIDGLHVNEDMIERGYAHKYNGGKREEWYSSHC